MNGCKQPHHSSVPLSRQSASRPVDPACKKSLVAVARIATRLEPWPDCEYCSTILALPSIGEHTSLLRTGPNSNQQHTYTISLAAKLAIVSNCWAMSAEVFDARSFFNNLDGIKKRQVTFPPLLIEPKQTIHLACRLELEVVAAATLIDVRQISNAEKTTQMNFGHTILSHPTCPYVARRLTSLADLCTRTNTRT